MLQQNNINTFFKWSKVHENTITADIDTFNTEVEQKQSTFNTLCLRKIIELESTLTSLPMQQVQPHD